MADWTTFLEWKLLSGKELIRHTQSAKSYKRYPVSKESINFGPYIDEV